MLKFTCFIVLLLMGALLFGQENVIKNGDFKRGATSWSVSTWRKDMGEIGVADGVLRIVNDSEKLLTMLQQAVTLQADKDYLLSFQMRCQDIASDGEPHSGAGVFVLHKGQSLVSGSTAGQFCGQTGSTDWQKVELRIDKSAQERRVTVYARLRHASGSAYFRDFRLAAIPSDDISHEAMIRLQPPDFQNGLMYLPADFPGNLFIELRMPKLQSGENIELVLTLPEAIRCLGMSPWLSDSVDQDGIARYLPVEMHESTPVPGLRSFRFSLPKTFCRRLMPNELAWNNYLRVYLQTSEKTPDSQAKIQIFRNGKLAGSEKNFLIKMLPPLPADLPKLQRFKVLVSYLFSLTVPIPEVCDAYLQYWRDITDKPITFPLYNWWSLPVQTQQLIEPDFQNIIFLGGGKLTPAGNFSAWRRENAPDLPLAINRDGKEMPQSACPSWSTSDPLSKIWEDYLPTLLRSRMTNLKNVIGIIWDSEPGAKYFCYCERCRSAFSRSQNVELLSTEEINQRFAAQWFAWRTQLNGMAINNFAAAVRRHFPEYRAMLCTDPLHEKKPHISEWCAVDVRDNDQGQYDLFANMFYYSGVSYYDGLEFNLKTLNTAQLPLINPTQAIEMYYSRYTPEKVVMNMFANAALGCEGIGFWRGDNFDGKYLYLIKAAAGLIAKAEKYYFEERLSGRVQLDYCNCQETVLTEGEIAAFRFLALIFRYTFATSCMPIKTAFCSPSSITIHARV